MFKEGGHIWIGHDQQVADAITNFLSRPRPSSQQLKRLTRLVFTILGVEPHERAMAL
jgi:hypothetical protein